MFYWLGKFKLETLINNHFIIKYFEYMVWSPCAEAVYFLNTFLARFTEVNANI